MDVQTTRPPALPARLLVRRRVQLSPAERFWMILGSLLGISLIPAAWIAVLTGDEDTGPGRAAPHPENGPRVAGGAGGAADQAKEDHAGADALTAAARALGQEEAGRDDLQAGEGTGGGFSAVALPGALLAAVSSGSSAYGRFVRDHAGGFEPPRLPHLLLPEVPDLSDRVAPYHQHAERTGYPDDWPMLADVTGMGSDDDTWGVLATYLIVSRAQDHMVETPDGALHMLINRGLDHGLTLISSRDGGDTWTAAASFGPANSFATSDIRLIDGQNVMIVSYLDSADNVSFSIYGYDALSGNWSQLLNTVIDSGIVAPQSVQTTVAISDEGSLLLAYTEEIADGLRLVLQQSLDGGRTWTESVLAQPGIAAGTARAIAAGDHAGVIYSNAEGMYWVTWDERSGWAMDLLDEAGTIGRFASHFSTVTIGDDVVVANVGTDLALHILHFDGETGRWDDPVAPLKPGTEVSSAQISISDDTGNIYVTFDDPDNLGRLVIIESRDGGETWQLEAVLQTPKDYVAPPTRFEAPEHFSGDLVVTQQILDPDNEALNGLYYHVVDVDGPGHPIPADVVLAHADDFLF